MKEDRRRDHRQILGAPDAFEVFYRREVNGVLAVTMGLTRRKWEAEEVTQEAFLRAYRDWHRVGLMDHPGAWVRRVALNLAVGRWRRARTEAAALLRLTAEDHPSPADPESARFWDEVRALPKRQAQVVALTYVDDLDADGVAAVLGIASSTVRVHLARAQATLAQRLGAEE